MVDSVVTEKTFTEVSSEALATTLQLCIINLQFVNLIVGQACTQCEAHTMCPLAVRL